MVYCNNEFIYTVLGMEKEDENRVKIIGFSQVADAVVDAIIKPYSQDTPLTEGDESYEMVVNYANQYVIAQYKLLSSVDVESAQVISSQLKGLKQDLINVFKARQTDRTRLRVYGKDARLGKTPMPAQAIAAILNDNGYF